MIPATLQADWPNPFAPLPVAATSEPAPGSGDPGTRDLPASAAAAELTPESIGLRLASVAIGPRRRTATISGQEIVVRGDIVLTMAGIAIKSDS